MAKIPAGQKVNACVMRPPVFLAQSRCKIKYLQQNFFVVTHQLAILHGMKMHEATLRK